MPARTHTGATCKQAGVNPMDGTLLAGVLVAISAQWAGVVLAWINRPSKLLHPLAQEIVKAQGDPSGSSGVAA